MYLAALLALVIAFISGCEDNKTKLQILGWLGWIIVTFLIVYIGA